MSVSRAFAFLTLILPVVTATAENSRPQPIDSGATEETQNLLAHLHHIGWHTDSFMFGQEFPLSYQREMKGINDPATSDLKEVVGDHPGVHGSDFHFMIDKDPHEIVAHKVAALTAYESGSMVTFDFHWVGKYGGTHSWHKEDAKILYNVVNDNDKRGDVTWFYQSLDEVIRIVNEDLQFPIVFRPFHEMNGNWFWWGSKLKGGPETYKQAYRILVDYIKERSDYFLFCWSPDKDLTLEYYPGSEYVDIIGFDGYGQGNPKVHWFTVNDMIEQLEAVVDFAAKEDKVAAFTETGYDTKNNVDYHTTRPDWWTQSVLDPILASEKASRIAWVLTWINSDWSGPYTPYSGSPEPSKEAFQKFHAHEATLFQEEVSSRSIYAPLR
ncbi:glycoside hydrolase family 26 protein [Pelagicoccus mobilis]|uniref:GH26 domain-containing protein n=1 Tax=Pelagicoccus mobilis TaxID=415221 RepID=A0A934VNY2_9BACT|nr:glycosyl hydrolase [Pelagicoccus mobilis]MBK1875240.1 hypothetical protein [Pelagicoccus mobilis]